MTAGPKEAAITDVSLREKPIDKLTANDINDMLLKYGFFEASINSSGSFHNTLVDNNDGTVRDSTTGLLWQKSGSSKPLNHSNSIKYIKSLNAKSFAGYSDWRMPTLEELASLLEKDNMDGVHIDSVFDNKQVRCWSADGPGTSETSSNFNGAWVLDYTYGKARKAIWPKRKLSAWMDMYIVLPDNYVKAVCSVNN